MGKRETIADIAAEMRSVPYYMVWTSDNLAEVADRMEAAHEREMADTQKTLHETPDSAEKSQYSPSNAWLLTNGLRAENDELRRQVDYMQSTIDALRDFVEKLGDGCDMLMQALEMDKELQALRGWRSTDGEC